MIDPLAAFPVTVTFGFYELAKVRSLLAMWNSNDAELKKTTDAIGQALDEAYVRFCDLQRKNYFP